MEYQVGKATHKVEWVLYNNAREGHSLGVTQAPSISVEGQEFRPESWVMICPHCGDLWARRYAVNSLAPEVGNWQVKRWSCRPCGNGSLWDAWNKPWNRSLPHALLVRELMIVKEWWDEGIRTYNQFFQYKHFRRKV